MKRIGKVLYKYWMKFAHVLGWINTRIILTLLFVLVFGLYAIVSKLVYVVQMPFRRKLDTYWKEKEFVEPTIENMRNQF